MDTQRIASYRREFSALADLQAAGTVTYSLLREADAFVICVQRDENRRWSGCCATQGRSAPGC